MHFPDLFAANYMARRALAYTLAGNSNDSLYNNLQMTNKSPLGTTTDYPQHYSPEQLFGIARAENRAALGLATAMPFHGVDIWNAWELTWLASNGLPQVACVELRVPADSPHIIESKSLKLYLGSFTMTEFASEAAVADALSNDIGACVGADVEIHLARPDTFSAASIGILAGDCLDRGHVTCDTWQVDAGLLCLNKQVEKQADEQPIVAETLHSHLLRSLCPVTGQPDCGSVMIQYRGPRIDRESLLKYIVSYRQHADFHENCGVTMFCTHGVSNGIRQSSFPESALTPITYCCVCVTICRTPPRVAMIGEAYPGPSPVPAPHHVAAAGIERGQRSPIMSADVSDHPPAVDQRRHRSAEIRERSACSCPLKSCRQRAAPLAVSRQERTPLIDKV